jgi:hypothetical protein
MLVTTNFRRKKAQNAPEIRDLKIEQVMKGGLPEPSIQRGKPPFLTCSYSQVFEILYPDLFMLLCLFVARFS